MKRLTKDILKLGDHFVSDKDGNRKKVTVTRDMVYHWINKFNAMRAKGLRVFAPWEHDFSFSPSRKVEDLTNAKNNGGEWVSLHLSNDGVFQGVIDPATEEDAQNIGSKVKGCSIFADNFVDGEGTEWDNVLHHICLTNKPVAITDNYKESPNSLAIAMSTSVSADNEVESQSMMLTLGNVLKEKWGVELPPANNISDFLRMMVVLLSNGLDGKEKGEIVPHTSMDIVMSTDGKSTEEPKLSAEDQGWRAKYDDLRKKHTSSVKAYKSLLGLVASRERESFKSRLTPISESLTGDDQKDTKARVDEMLASVDKVEFQLDVAENKLKKTPFETELELIETYVKKLGEVKSPEKKSDKSEEKFEVEPPEDNDDGSMTEEQVAKTLASLGVE